MNPSVLTLEILKEDNVIPKIDFALDQQPREPLPAPVFTALCPGSPCTVCGTIEDAGGITATPRTRGLCTAHFKAETQITLKTETGANAHLCAAYVATLPTGERVELPAGTVLREGTLPPEPEDDRPTLGEQILADLTERVGLPREMAPSVEPDPWLRGLTITTANAIRSGIDRGLPAKAGVAAVIAAFQAGVDMAIPPKP